MPVAAGTRIGPYTVVAKLGEGGMGQVYRARDTRLDRDVAIKILPEAFAADPDRLARFEREAKTLASLNHPNIAQIYGLESDGGESDGATRGQRALVMELVEGEDLSATIARGPMALADVQSIARQIAEALETAHENGIIHRDLKPANIKVRRDGTVKVLDFGLAKAFMSPGSEHPDLANSPTVTSPALTERGVLLGTAAYMSPEQARARPVDKRADIWAFGVVLYEMLTGTRAFAGQSLPDVLAAVVKREIDWSRLPRHTPAQLRALLERCLEPDPKLRLRDIGEARVVVSALDRGSDSQSQAPPSNRRRILVWSAAALAVAAAAFGLSHWIGPSPEATADRATRLSIMPPPGALMNPDSSNTALSPDGRMVVFVVGTGISIENQLWVRELASADARRIESGDGVSLPFWSPDSTQIGFFAGRKLKVVAAAGGSARVLCDAPFGRGAAWNGANSIVFAPDADSPLYRVSTDGGAPVQATTLDATRKETSHRFPVFLPDNRHFLYAALPGPSGVADVFAGSLNDAQLKAHIGSMDTSPAYAAPGPSTRSGPGWLLFTRQGVLVAQPFDASTLKTTGSVVSLGDEPRAAPGTAAYDAGRRVTVSTTGSLAFIPEPSTNTNLLWMDPSGKSTGAVTVPAGRYETVVLAPDETRAVLVRREQGTARTLWLIDLTRASAVPIGSTVPVTSGPAWSRDSQRVAFVEIKDGQWQLSEKAVADSSPPRRIAAFGGQVAYPTGWARGDILFSRIAPDTKWNVYRLAESGQSDPIPVIETTAIEVGGQLSPDGRWIAYHSDESGRLDVFVQSYPARGAKAQVSTGGVKASWWNRDGREVVYLRRDQTLWRVSMTFRAGQSPLVGKPEPLGEFPPALLAMDLATKSQRLLALVPERAALDAVTVIQSWRAAVTPR